MTYVEYSPALEHVDEDEAESFDRIATTFLTQGRVVCEQVGHALRVSHAKSTALLRGALTVPGDLPPELAQGLFAKAGRYGAIVRLAQGPGELLDDSISTHRGAAIKILGVTGERIAESREHATQDFILEDGAAFINSDAKRFLLNLKGGVSNAPHLPDGFKQAVSTVARGAEAALEAVGGKSKTLGFFGHPPLHPLSEAYFSQVPMRWGNHVAKVGLFPGKALLSALSRLRIDTRDDANAFATAVAEHFRANDAAFELKAQLCTDPDDMPIEDASVEWPEEKSAYRTVGSLTIPPQGTGAKDGLSDDNLSFSPANSLAAHRPLGQIMRARLFVYGRLANARAAANGVALTEPRAATAPMAGESVG